MTDKTNKADSSFWEEHGRIGRNTYFFMLNRAILTDLFLVRQNAE